VNQIVNKTIVLEKKHWFD